MSGATRSVVAACALLGALSFAGTQPANAAFAQPATPAGIEFDQHLGDRVPLDTPLTDSDGRTTTLSALLDGRPAIVVPGYYECPNLCSAVRLSLRASLARVDLDDSRYRVIAVSIDPGESPADALHARDALDDDGAGPGARDASRPGAGGDALPPVADAALRGWHFLTGTPAATHALADAIGFHYVYDAALRQYAHPSGVVVITPSGRISHYFFGVDYPPRALRASLMAARDDEVGAPVRALLLRCFHYDPAIGRHSGAVVVAARVLGVGCVVLLAAMLVWLRRRGAGPRITGSGR